MAHMSKRSCLIKNTLRLLPPFGQWVFDKSQKKEEKGSYHEPSFYHELERLVEDPLTGVR